MAQLQLDGNVDNRDALIAQLEDELRQSRMDLATARADLSRARQQNTAAVAELRRQLEPLHRALQAVFGEIEVIVPDSFAAHSDGQQAPASDARVKAVLDSWKQRLGNTAAKVIDALLVHGDLNTSQLALATGLNRNTVPKVIYELNKAGLINKNGGRFSVKQL